MFNNKTWYWRKINSIFRICEAGESELSSEIIQFKQELISGSLNKKQ